MAHKYKRMTIVSLTVLVVIFFQNCVWAAPIGLPFKCKRSSPDLNNCVREGLTRLFKLFKAGSAQLGIPPLDPLEVPLLVMKSDQESNFTLDLLMKNIRITGLTDIVFAKVSTNLDDVNKVEVSGKTSALQFTGQYISEGLIVNFPLHSSGSFSVNMTEVTSSWVVYFHELIKGQDKYLQIDGFDVDMMPINISFRPAVQLDGDNHLGEAVDIILNENSQEIYSAIKSRLSRMLSEVFTELANSVLLRIPENVFLEP